MKYTLLLLFLLGTCYAQVGQTIANPTIIPLAQPGILVYQDSSATPISAIPKIRIYNITTPLENNTIFLTTDGVQTSPLLFNTVLAVTVTVSSYFGGYPNTAIPYYQLTSNEYVDVYATNSNTGAPINVNVSVMVIGY